MTKVFRLVIRTHGNMMTVIESTSTAPILEEVSNMVKLMRKDPDNNFSIDITQVEQDW